jgi:large subunit ribosomal protein L12
MEYVYAALLIHNAGKQITPESISAVLKAAGISPDITRAKALVASLEGINIEEVLEKASFAASAPVQKEAEEKKEEKKEEKPKVEEKKEESAMEGLSALFD